MLRRACGRMVVAGAAGALAGALLGCQASPAVTPDEAFAPSTIVLDGSIHDWPEDAALLADEDYWYFRVSVADAEHALQAAPYTLALWLDLDSDPSTGLRRDGPGPARDLGTDLEVLFSPPGPDGAPGTGVAVHLLERDGTRTTIDHAEADLVFAPTYAAQWHEGRISRDILGHEALADLPRIGTATGMFAVLEDGAPTNSWSDPVRAEAPAWDDSPDRAFALVPACEQDAVRVMSWNVLDDAPVDNAAPFARVIDAIDPDVILLQEWDYAAPQLSGWFTALVDSPTPWVAVADETSGVAVVARHELEPLGQPVEVDGRRVRFVAGIADTPAGPLAIGSAHLKCCGGASGPEDETRLAEAEAISDAMAAWLDGRGVDLRAVGGDLNLVGTRPPLDAIRAGLDADGSALEVVEAYVLGDAAQYTWSDPDGPFTPGRLDYVCVSDATAEIVRAFVLDTTRLDEEALARMGLDAADTGASDHLPLVVDIRAR